MSNKIPASALSCLCRFGIRKNLKAGKIIQFQDDQVEDVYVIEEGIAVARFYQRRGKESWIDSFRSGEMIGAEHIQSGGPSHCQILAQTDVTVLQFKRTAFLDLMAKNPDINLFIINQLTSRLKRLQESRVENHLLSKRGRVASEIRRMASPANEKDSSYVVCPKPVISDMALRLGIARETVSRTVSDLVKTQVIERNRNAFFVPDLSLLEAQMR